MNAFAQWLNDRRWAANMRRIRAYRRTLLFSQRRKFDQALRPPLGFESVVDYPDAIYSVTIDDALRAICAAHAPT